MYTLIEISIYGELYLFSNTLTTSEYKLLHDFTIKFFKQTDTNSTNINIDDFIDSFFQTYKIKLHQLYIDIVISI